MNRSGKDFGRARAVAIDEHGERTLVNRRIARVVENLHVTAGLTQLHDRSVIDEQTAELGCLGEVAAAVLPQIHDDAVDAFLLELADETGDVARRARIVLVAATARREVLIKARDRNDADLVGSILERDVEHFALRGLFLELDLVARQIDDLLRRARCRAARKNLQMDHRAARSANLLYDFVEAPADDVDQLALRTLADRGDAVLGLQAPVDLRRTPGDDRDDGHEVIVRLQRRTDPVVREAHLDSILFALARRKVARVRVHRVGHGVHVGFEDVVGGQLRDPLQRALVACLEHFGGFGPGLTGQHQRKRIAFDLLPPDIVHFLRGDGPAEIAAVEAIVLVDRVVGLRHQQGERLVDSLRGPLPEQVEHVEYRLELAAARAIVELVAVAAERSHVAREKVHAIAVERIEILVQNRRGQRVVELRTHIMQLFDQLGDVAANRRVLLLHLQGRQCFHVGPDAQA